MAFTEQQLGQLNLMIGESIRRGLAEGLAAAPQPSLHRQQQRKRTAQMHKTIDVR